MSNTYDAFNSWKPLLYRDRIEQILDGVFPDPVTVHIYPTNRCNRDCRWCIMREERKGNAQLPEFVFADLIATLVACSDVKAIHIAGGGEPTLYPHLDHISRFQGLKVLSTNGSILSRSTASRFDRIRVSLDAGTKQTFDQVHGPGPSWEQTIERIELCAYQGRSYQLGLGMVADWDNWGDIPAMCSIAEALALDFVHIRPAYYPRGTDEEKRVRSVAGAIYHAAEAAKQVCSVPVFAISEKFDGFWTPQQYTQCRATPLQAVVNADARLSVCLDVFHKFGNLNTQTFWEAWQSDEHRQAIEAIKLYDCPRCVMNKANEIIENCFINDELLGGLL